MALNDRLLIDMMFTEIGAMQMTPKETGVCRQCQVRVPRGNQFCSQECSDADDVRDGLSRTSVIHVSLHTSDPTVGDPVASETTYTGYARVKVAAHAGNWLISERPEGGTLVTNANALRFPACTGNAQRVTHFAVHRGGAMMFSTRLDSGSFALEVGDSLCFDKGALTVSLD